MQPPTTIPLHASEKIGSVHQRRQDTAAVPPLGLLKARRFPGRDSRERCCSPQAQSYSEIPVLYLIPDIGPSRGEHNRTSDPAATRDSEGFEVLVLHGGVCQAWPSLSLTRIFHCCVFCSSGSDRRRPDTSIMHQARHILWLFPWVADNRQRRTFQVSIDTSRYAQVQACGTRKDAQCVSKRTHDPTLYQACCACWKRYSHRLHMAHGRPGSTVVSVVEDKGID